MQDKLTKQLPWILAHLVWFLALPMAAYFFPEDMVAAALMVIVALANPIFCAITGLFYSLRGNRSWIFLLYPVVGWIGTLFIYYNTSAWLYAVLGVACSLFGMVFGRWARRRKQSEAEKWVENQKPASPAKPSAPASDYTPRVASKTAMKNQQKAAARKAKERAEKEEKIRQKNAPKKKKKKKGGH